MKQSFSFWLIIFLNLIFIKANGQSSIDWTVEQLKLLSPEEYEVLFRYNVLPDNFSVNTEYGIMSSSKMGSLLQYMNGGDRFDCLSDISINVHEINHILTGLYPYEYCRQRNRVLKEKRMYYFYIERNNEMPIFSNVEFFPSVDIFNEIPEEKRTYRFDTYINGNTSTQDDGLLGLLDEYNSYQHSLNTVWDLKNAFLNATKSEVEGYINWMSSLYSYIEAYYEFRYFILEYLRYARLSEPEVYNQVRNESDLISVFNRLTNSFRTTITKYDKEICDSKSYWQKLGYDVISSEDEDFCYIGINGVYNGFKVKLEDKEKLLPVLKSQRYDEVIYELKIIP